MVSQTVINVLGIIGGVVLAICQAPQLIKLYRTKSAADLSFSYLILYSIGLFFITVYLYLENATVGWICESIETACGVALILAKWYLDTWGPYGKRPRRPRGAPPASLEGGDASGPSAANSQAMLLQQRSSGGGGAHKKAAASDAGSDGSVQSAVDVGAEGLEAAAAAPGVQSAAAAGSRLRERRRSHDVLPI